MPLPIIHHCVSFTINNGAKVNLLSLAALRSLTVLKCTSHWPLQTSVAALTDVQGAKSIIHGIVVLLV